MLKLLEIKNFQSHNNTKMEFHENINVVHGLSDSGKTAFIRSLNCLLLKDPFYITYGKKEGVIHGVFDDLDISRVFVRTSIRKCTNCKEEINKNTQICDNCGTLIPKKHSSDYYMINGEKKEKFGIKLPDFLQKQIAIYPYDFVSETININIANQDDGFFFVGKDFNNIRNNMISSLIIDSEKIDKLIKKYGSDKHGLRSEVRLKTDIVKEYENKIELVGDDLTKTSEIVEKLINADKKLFLIKSRQDTYTEIKTEIDSLADFDKALKLYPTLKNDMDSINAGYDKLEKNKGVLSDIKSIRDSLTSIELPEKESIDSMVRVMKDNEIKLDELENIHSTITELKKLKSENVKFSHIPKKLDVLTIPEKLESIGNDISELKQIKKNVNDIDKELEAITNETNKLNVELKELKVKLIEFVDNGAVCPITNKPYCDECREVIKNG